jgi:uncharacterized RDD family membrane protein YckC
MDNTDSGNSNVAGFWRRAWANFFVDTYILSIGVSLLMYVGYLTNREILIITCVLSTLTIPIYFVYFHSIWGQSFGRILLGIKLIDKNGGAVSAKQAWLRYSVDFAFALFFCAMYVASLLKVSDEQFAGMTYMERIFLPFSFLSLATTMIIGWSWQILNLIIFFTNSQRRTIRDYVAGTRAVKLNSFTKYPKKKLSILAALAILTQQLFMRALQADGGKVAALFIIGALFNILLIYFVIDYVRQVRLEQGDQA